MFAMGEVGRRDKVVACGDRGRLHAAAGDLPGLIIGVPDYSIPPRGEAGAEAIRSRGLQVERDWHVKDLGVGGFAGRNFSVNERRLADLDVGDGGRGIEPCQKHSSRPFLHVENLQGQWDRHEDQSNH